jgi:hypothetical protein
MKNKLSLLFILSVAVLFNACNKKERLFTKIIYQGLVYEKTACTCNHPAEGVLITLKACEGHDGPHGENCLNRQYIVGQVRTDKNGQFFIKDKAARTNWYFVYKQKDPYENAAVNGPEGTSAKGLHTAEYREIHLN